MSMQNGSILGIWLGRILIHTLELKIWHFECLPYVCTGKPCICNVSRPRVTYVHPGSLTTPYALMYYPRGWLWSWSGGRPHGTTRDRAGYDVGQSGGRPHGTTREVGYDVGRSRGRPKNCADSAVSINATPMCDIGRVLGPNLHLSDFCKLTTHHGQGFILQYSNVQVYR